MFVEQNLEPLTNLVTLPTELVVSATQVHIFCDAKKVHSYPCVYMAGACSHRTVYVCCICCCASVACPRIECN